MASVAYPSTRPTAWPPVASRHLSLSWPQAKVVVVVLSALLALGFRVTALSTYGLSEDEINKVRAIEHYQAGDFTANAEHPMLMKLAMWASVEMAGVWNLVAPSDQAMPIETAMRLPNAVAGAAT